MGRYIGPDTDAIKKRDFGWICVNLAALVPKLLMILSLFFFKDWKEASGRQRVGGLLHVSTAQTYGHIATHFAASMGSSTI